MHWSYSSLNIPCPRALAKKVAKDPVEVVISEQETDEGINLHAMMQDFANAYWQARNKVIEKNPRADADTIKSELEGLIAEHRMRLSEAIGDEYVAVKLTNFVHSILAGAKDMKAEHWLEFETTEGDKFVGRVDLLVTDASGSIFIIDYKSTHSVPKGFGDTEQMEFYALDYLLAGHDVAIAKVFLRYGAERWIWLHPDDYARIMSKLERKIKQSKEMLANPYKTQPSWYCNYCPFRMSCKAVADPQTPQELALEMVRLEAKLSAIKAELRAYTERYGAIEVESGGTIYQVGHFKTEQVKTHPDAVKALIDMQAIDLLKPDTAKLKKRTDLEGVIYKIDVATRFTVKKSKAK